MERWNRHLLAPSKSVIFSQDRLISLYHLPKLFDSASWLIPVSYENTTEFDDPLFATDVPYVSPEFQEFANIVFERQFQ